MNASFHLHVTYAQTHAVIPFSTKRCVTLSWAQATSIYCVLDSCTLGFHYWPVMSPVVPWQPSRPVKCLCVINCNYTSKFWVQGEFFLQHHLQHLCLLKIYDRLGVTNFGRAVACGVSGRLHTRWAFLHPPGRWFVHCGCFVFAPGHTVNKNLFLWTCYDVWCEALC